jgi:uncharacterized membrane protein
MFSDTQNVDLYYLMDPITVVGAAGILICLYAIYVEHKSKTKGYTASCDLGENASCTVVLSSKYSRMAKIIFNLNRKSLFNVPNTYYGLLFYVAITLYPVYPFTMIYGREILLGLATTASLLASIGLACILAFKLKNFCAICAATYVVNMVLAYYTYYELLAIAIF